MRNITQIGQKPFEWQSETFSTLRHGGEDRTMLKTVKRIHQSPQLKAVPKDLDRSAHNAETEMSSLFNIDPYPKSEKSPKIDLRLPQLEDFE